MSEDGNWTTESLCQALAQSETAREGMGIMIAAIVVLIALATAVRNRAAAHKAG